MALDEAGTRFLDGMRVATEHMRHLQQTSVDRARQLRVALGAGGVAHGYKTEPVVEANAAGAAGAAGVVGAAGAPGTVGQVRVSPGLAIDGHGRPLVLEAITTVAVPEGRHWLVALYSLRSSLLVGGVPTLLSNAVTLQARALPPPYEDGAVPFAEVSRAAENMELLQKGEWYLPPLAHRHSGGFYTDAAGRWRYDGAPVSTSTGSNLAPHFDSGWVSLAAGENQTLAHGLQSQHLLVEMTTRSPGGVVSNRGIGSRWWFELPDDEHITLFSADAESDLTEIPAAALALRARAWRTDGAAPAPGRPLADAGADMAVEPGTSFTLDASRSRAAGGRHLVRYQWTLLS